MSLALIYSTFPDKKTASQISMKLLDNKLIKCANMIPEMTSIYEWEGEIKSEQEVVVLFKTIDVKYKKVEAFIKKHHPYDTPCIFKISIDECEKKFAKWLAS